MNDYIDEEAIRKIAKPVRINPPRKSSHRPIEGDINWQRIERQEASEGRTEQVYDNEYLNEQEEDSG